jgi:Brp/Blh family beta-carotene 15,15'-monooxygenase
MINNIKRINLNHSFVFFLFCNIISLITFKAKNFSISPLICLFLILVIGVSHGSLDHIKGKRLLKIFDIKNVLFFYVSYILLAIFIILFWVLLPAISLLLFLVVASYHFGKEDTQFLTTNNNLINQLLFFFKGSLIILAPMFFHFDETVTIYKFLLVEDEAFYTILDYIETNKILLIGIVLSTLSSVLLFIKEFEIKKFVIFLDYFSIIILNYYLPPLVAFTLYFCFLHSLRHTITLIFEIDNFDFNNGLIKFLKKALPLTILTAVFCIISLFFLNNIYDLNSSILKVIFIGLASLTFPHILLEYLLEKYEKQNN